MKKMYLSGEALYLLATSQLTLLRVLLILLTGYVAFCAVTGQIAWGATYGTTYGAVQGVTASNRIITSMTSASIAQTNNTSTFERTYITSNNQNYVITKDSKFDVNASCRKIYDPTVEPNGAYAWSCWWQLLGETGWFLGGTSNTAYYNTLGFTGGMEIVEPDMCRITVQINAKPEYLEFNVHDPVCTMGCH